MRVAVEPRIFNSLRSFRCQRYGQGKATCRQGTACTRCGQEGHDDKDCPVAPHCVNCSCDHLVYSRNCPQWRHQLEVSKIKWQKGVIFREAEELVRRSSPTTTSTLSSNSLSGVPRGRPVALSSFPFRPPSAPPNNTFT
jgi:hypothetical protein